jgi:hypothetical protein
MVTSVDDFSLELPGGVEAGPAARQAVVEHLTGLADVVQADVLLLVTELVTNAVRHGDRLRFLVTDPGTKLLRNGGPTVRSPNGRNGDSGSGWGLYFVEQVAERWGVLAAQPGTCVWFEVAG